MTTAPKRRIEVDGVTLLWGNPAEWKAELRDESMKRHLALPIAERLQAALDLVLTHDEAELLGRRK